MVIFKFLKIINLEINFVFICTKKAYERKTNYALSLKNGEVVYATKNKKINSFNFEKKNSCNYFFVEFLNLKVLSCLSKKNYNSRNYKNTLVVFELFFLWNLLRRFLIRNPLRNFFNSNIYYIVRLLLFTCYHSQQLVILTTLLYECGSDLILIFDLIWSF